MMKPSAKLTAVATIAFFTSYCSELLVPESNQDSNVADVEAAWSRIEDVYPLLEYKGIDWDGLRPQYLERAESAEGDEILFVLSDLVAEIKDGHSRVYAAGGATARPYTPHRFTRDRGAYNPTVIRNYFSEPLVVAGLKSFEYGLMDNGIGYIRFSSMGSNIGYDDVDEVIADFDLALELLINASGLIIDLRNNSGGGGLMPVRITGRLIDSPIRGDSSFTVTEVYPTNTFSPEGPIQYTSPIVILINGTTFSAAEIFPERLRQLEYVTLVGDTTAGGGVGSNGPDPQYYLPSGRSIKINYHAFLRLDGEPIEGNGVLPDILISQTKTDADAGRDLQLEAAIVHLMN